VCCQGQIGNVKAVVWYIARPLQGALRNALYSAPRHPFHADLTESHDNQRCDP
jgi:hypothetical protein